MPVPTGSVMYPTGFELAFNPYYTHKDLAVLLKAVAATEQQVPVLESLASDYSQTFHTEAPAFQARVRDAAPIVGVSQQAHRELVESYQHDIETLIRTHAEAGDTSPEADLAHNQAIEQRARALEDSIRTARLEALKSASTQESLAKMFSEFEAWLVRRAELQREFETNVRSLLDPSQQAAWEQLQREFRRAKSLRKSGRLAGESVDLIQLFGRMDPAPLLTDSVQAALAAYELSIDEAVRQRDDALAMLDRELDRALAAAEGDTVRRVLTERAKQHSTVRDANLEAAASIEATLDDAAKTNFRALLRQQAFPRIYRRSATERRLQAAEALSDLSEDARASVTDLAADLRAELAALEQALQSKWVEAEPDHLAARDAAGYDLFDFAGEPASDWLSEGGELHQAFLARAVLDQRFAQLLSELLTPEQLDQLPRTGHEADDLPTPPHSGGDGPDQPPPPAPQNAMTHEQFRQWLRDSFDADGDGELSDPERETAVEYLRKHPELVPQD
jgi:hypothetical protein